MILHANMKYVFLIIFLVQDLITSDDPISIWLPWIWNARFWVGVESFKKYRECDKMQNIRVRTKYKR